MLMQAVLSRRESSINDKLFDNNNKPENHGTDALGKACYTSNFERLDGMSERMTYRISTKSECCDCLAKETGQMRCFEKPFNGCH